MNKELAAMKELLKEANTSAQLRWETLDNLLVKVKSVEKLITDSLTEKA